MIAVTVTSRAAEFDRLLRSLLPVAFDPYLHIVVLDNGVADCDAIARRMQRESHRCAGVRSTVRSTLPLLPLPRARQELSAAVHGFASQLSGTPIIWMIDDDMTFEEVRIDDGALVSHNVAIERIASARELSRSDIDILVSGFTGDPPVRPEAVLASQMEDLLAALRLVADAHPSDEWACALPYIRTPDDFYDHAEPPSEGHPGAPVPWLPRQGQLRTIGAQLRAMLDESCTIPRGCTPFRPLLGPGEQEQVRVPRADRGGNTVFRGLDYLRAISYPTFLTGSQLSRRADMVGLNLLLRETSVVVARGGLTLRHDRTLQPALTSDIEPWLAEFGGVLLSRATSPTRTDEVSLQAISAMANERADRILHALDRAIRATETCQHLLHTRDAWWQRDPAMRPSREALCLKLEGLLGVLLEIRCSRLEDAMRSKELQHRVLAAFIELQGASV